MTNAFFFGVGLVLVLLGILLALRPDITQWVADRTNRRFAEWQGRFEREYYPTDLRRMRRWLPVGLIVIGTGWIGQAIRMWI